MLIMTPEKQDKTLELSKHWSADSTPARNEEMIWILQFLKETKICDSCKTLDPSCVGKHQETSTNPC